MSGIFWTKVLPLIIYFCALFVLPTFFAGDKKIEGIPRSVRISSWVELVFGLMVFFSGAVYLFFMDPEKVTNPAIPMLAFSVSVFIGMVWLIMAVKLSHGSRKARQACLILSVLRIPTGVGIVFSLIDLYLLYFTGTSKRFYSQHPEEEAKPA